jgi:hypothetical protein
MNIAKLLPFPKKNDALLISNAKKMDIRSSWIKLLPESQGKVIRDLKQLASDKTQDKSGRHDAIKKLALFNQPEAAKTIINEYVLPENTTIRSVLRKRLLGIVTDNPVLKPAIVQKLQGKAASSTDGLAQNLLDEVNAIHPPTPVQPSTVQRAYSAYTRINSAIDSVAKPVGQVLWNTPVIGKYGVAGLWNHPYNGMKTVAAGALLYVTKETAAEVLKPDNLSTLLSTLASSVSVNCTPQNATNPGTGYDCQFTFNNR